MNLDEVWRELTAAARSPGEGTLKRRLYPAGGLDLFAAVRRPSNQRVLLMKLNTQSLRQEDLPSCRGLDLLLRTDEHPAGSGSLAVALSDDSLTDIFLALCSDLVNAVGPVKDPNVASTKLIARLERWQRFLEHTRPEGLGPEQQRGLYGELWTMRHDLIGTIGPEQAVRAWRAPSLANHDFELPGLALEVKTSAGKAHQKLHIASERQLEKADGQRLIIDFISLDVQQSTGEGLDTAVNELRILLEMTPSVGALFEQKLFEWGYLAAHARKYGSPLYRVREQLYFEVNDAFPRIVGADLRPGVGDVHYSINLSECTHHLIPGNAVKSLLQDAARAR